MKYTLTGYLKKKNPIVTLGSKGFQKSEIWVDLDGTQYPQTLCFSLMRGSLLLAEPIELGTHISIDFELAGRVWQDRCFNELVVLDLSPIDEIVEDTGDDIENIDKLFAEIEGEPTDEVPF